MSGATATGGAGERAAGRAIVKKRCNRWFSRVAEIYGVAEILVNYRPWCRRGDRAGLDQWRQIAPHRGQRAFGVRALRCTF